MKFIKNFFQSSKNIDVSACMSRYNRDLDDALSKIQDYSSKNNTQIDIVGSAPIWKKNWKGKISNINKVILYVDKHKIDKDILNQINTLIDNKYVSIEAIDPNDIKVKLL